MKAGSEIFDQSKSASCIYPATANGHCGNAHNEREKAL